MRWIAWCPLAPNTSKQRKSYNSNIIKIPISGQPVHALYKVCWFHSETGLAYNFSDDNVPVQHDSMGNRFILISFPSAIRDLANHSINNTFGDAVFAIFLKPDLFEPRVHYY